jgi:hypothetical protein
MRRIGKSKNFRKDSYKGNDAVRFDVSKLQLVECPAEYKDYHIGWHAYKQNPSVAEQEITAREFLQPPFIQDMETCNWEKFEKYCSFLLRLIGIHDLHVIPPTSNRGKADGFFKFQNLAVIYDATLYPEFVKKKDQQIENYVNQLKKDRLEFNGRHYTITDAVKQVWIITRGKEENQLPIMDHIKIKEIPYQKLVDIYHKRLEKEIGVFDLVDLLKDLS